VQFMQLNSFFIKYDPLAVVFPEFPMFLHLPNLCIHLLLSLYTLLDFGHLIIKRLVELSNVCLSTVDILLVEGGELEDFFFEFEIKFVKMIQLSVFFIEPFPILVN
jgi:hypothetical protein